MRKHVASFLLIIGLSSTSFSQSLTTIILPQYIQGINGTNSNRIPFAYRVRLTGLLANATYRYFNQIVTSSDAATTNGAGNCIFVSLTGDFSRTSNPSLSTAGAYGTIVTDGSGRFEGWFITEPTGNARFVPGRYVFMRIALNDGASGTTVATRLTTADSVRVVKLDRAASDSTGTGLRCTTAASAKDFVFTYNDIDGQGRPISGSFIESDGTDNSTANNYAVFYANRVNGVDGAFGVVLPNVLPNGVRRIERRSLAAGVVVTFANDGDGIWPSGANTVNPEGGTTEIVLAGTDVGQLSTGASRWADVPTHFALSQNYPNPFNPATVITYELPVPSHVVLTVHDVLGREVATLVNEVKQAGSYSVSFSTVRGNASTLSSGVYFYTMTAGTFRQTKRMILIK